MVDLVQVILLVVFGIIGTVISMVLGWSESHEPFDAKKAVSTLIRGSVAILLYIVANYALAIEINWIDYVIIALVAAGFDAVLKRAQATQQNK